MVCWDRVLKGAQRRGRTMSRPVCISWGTHDVLGDGFGYSILLVVPGKF